MTLSSALTMTNPCLKLCAKSDRLPPLRFDCGTEDPLIQHNRELSRELKKAGIPYVYEEFSGGHSWTYWETHLADMLRFFAARLNETIRELVISIFHS